MHIQFGPGEPPEDGEMTRPSRHRIRNSNPGELRSSTLPLGHGGSHNTKFQEWMGKKHFYSFQTAETGNRAPNSSVKGGGANHYPRTPALYTVQKECFETPLLVATQLQPILVFGNTICRVLKHNECFEIFSVVV